MTYAQISDGVVKNVIVLNDDAQAPLFVKGHDHCVRIDHLVPEPGMGWFYDGKSFSKTHNPKVEGGIPSEVPKGIAATFPRFTINKGDYDFEVFVERDLLHVGCHVYNYKWARYALWMIKEHSSSGIGPLKNAGDGVRYENNFHILQSDVDLVYQALCTLQ